MKRKNAIFVIGLMIFCLIFLCSCGLVSGPSNGNGNGDELKFAYDVEVIYERIDPFVSNDHIDDSIYACVDPVGSLVGWSPVQVKMEKLTERNFKCTIDKLPAGVELFAYIQDTGRSSAGGPEFNGRIIKLNGTELTDIRDDPNGNGWKVPFFMISENGVVIP